MSANENEIFQNLAAVRESITTEDWKNVLLKCISSENITYEKLIQDAITDILKNLNKFIEGRRNQDKNGEKILPPLPSMEKLMDEVIKILQDPSVKRDSQSKSDGKKTIIKENYGSNLDSYIRKCLPDIKLTVSRYILEKYLILHIQRYRKKAEELSEDEKRISSFLFEEILSSIATVNNNTTQTYEEIIFAKARRLEWLQRVREDNKNDDNDRHLMLIRRRATDIIGEAFLKLWKELLPNYDSNKGKFNNYIGRAIKQAMLEYINIDEGMFGNRDQRKDLWRLNIVINKYDGPEEKNSDAYVDAILKVMNEKYQNMNYKREYILTLLIVQTVDLPFGDEELTEEGNESSGPYVFKTSRSDTTVEPYILKEVEQCMFNVCKTVVTTMGKIYGETPNPKHTIYVQYHYYAKLSEIHGEERFMEIKEIVNQWNSIYPEEPIIIATANHDISRRGFNHLLREHKERMNEFYRKMEEILDVTICESKKSDANYLKGVFDSCRELIRAYPNNIQKEVFKS